MTDDIMLPNLVFVYLVIEGGDRDKVREQNILPTFIKYTEIKCMVKMED